MLQFEGKQKLKNKNSWKNFFITRYERFPLEEKKNSQEGFPKLGEVLIGSVLCVKLEEGLVGKKWMGCCILPWRENATNREKSTRLILLLKKCLKNARRQIAFW